MTTKETQQKMPGGEQKGTAADYNHIKKVIAVMSGKGGVGKSFTTGLLASGLARLGLKTGVLDADITGPSIPLLFGLHGKVTAGEVGILPLASRSGIKVMSMNLLLDKEDQPVIWRGPLVSRAIQQLWGDVMWGDLDALLIDLPPGTSDATLTIMQSLPVNGLVMVTTPQRLASMVVRKAVHMAQIVSVDIIGIIENMAYFPCPGTGEEYSIFGESHSDEVAETAQAPILAHIPIYPQISDFCDAGNVEGIDFTELTDLLSAFLKAAHLSPGDERVNVPPASRTVENPEAAAHQQTAQKGEGEDLARYSQIAQDIITSQENLGRLDVPTYRWKFRGCCGDSMQIELAVEGNSIVDARYLTDGCFATMACGGMLMRLIKGKTMKETQLITAEDLLAALGGMPAGHEHCASLAVKTLRETIQNCRLDDPLVVSRNDIPEKLER